MGSVIRRIPRKDVQEPVKCWKLTLEYDGSKYFGWQEQKHERTVQGELRNAAEGVLGAEVELGGAGRTDAGVHALGQVAHLKVPTRVTRGRGTNEQLLQALNEELPADIVILKISDAHPRFHARHDATSRSYVYRISVRKTAFAKKHVWWVKERLDLEKMKDCTKMLSGRHDFASFSKYDRSRPEESTIVVVESAELEMADDQINFRITASHFLWNQVRRTVGALVDVGRGQMKVEDFARLVRNEPTEVMPITAPASGLFLEKVSYRTP